MIQIDDHHQTTAKITELFETMRAAVFPNGIEAIEFKKFLYAVQHVERYRAKDVKAGRRPRFERKKLLSGAALCRAILDNAAGGRISLLYFISNCLPVLSYPHDIQAALDKKQIGLHEARTLARISEKNLGSNVKRKAVEIRRELLASHLKRQGTQKELRERVNDRLAGTGKAQAEAVSYLVAANDLKVSELIRMSEFDTEHLLWEEIKSLVFLTREIDAGNIEKESLKEILIDLGKIADKILKFKPKPNVRTIKF